jgi:hypothetical protein
VVVLKAEYIGRYAHRNSTLPGQKPRNKDDKPMTRQQLANLPTPPTFTIPPTPPDVEEGRMLRRRSDLETPCCSNYGRTRTTVFPTYYFCSACKTYDEDKQCLTIRNLIRRTSRTYKCTSKHTSWVSPTQTLENFWLTKCGKRGENSSAKGSSRKKRKLRNPIVLKHVDSSSDESIITTPEPEPVIVIDKDEVIRNLHITIHELREYNSFISKELASLTEVINEHEIAGIQLTEQNKNIREARENDRIVQRDLENINQILENEILDEKSYNLEQAQQFEALKKKCTMRIVP